MTNSSPKPMSTQNQKCDFLIIGSGIAGLSCALRLADEGQVTVISKNTLEETATRYAQGGIAAVHQKEDSFDHHIEDTIKAGAGLCHEETVKMVVEAGPTAIEELTNMGVEFTHQAHSTEFHLTKEGGHSKRRVFHSHDATGFEIQRALSEKAKAHSNIQIIENAIAIDLVTSEKLKSLNHFKQTPLVFEDRPKEKCLGAYILNTNKNEVITLQSKVTILATGGAGKVYLYSSNPDTASGDGIAMAYRAGCRVANMEFMQFHPTCLFHPKAKRFLITESIRGEGGILKDLNGKPFMKSIHPQAELAPRDVVARAIDHQMKKSGHKHVFLDITHKGEKFIKEHFPNIYEKCLSLGIDIVREPIPVVPAAHYLCGGVVTDLNGKTTIDGLYAIGETAFTGLHGANRLASNSLLEGAVFSTRAAQSILKNGEWKKESNKTLPNWKFGNAVESDERVNVAHNWDEIRRLMWNYVGIVRSNKRLIRAQDRLQVLEREIDQYYWGFEPFSDLVELRNIVLLAGLIVKSALLRKESRGLHYNLDHPYLDEENFKKDTIL